MKLTTIRTAGTASGTTAALVDGEEVIELDRTEDVGALLRRGGVADAESLATGARHRLDEVELAPVVTRPGKIICVGLNYRAHILEMKRDLPEAPTLFAKYDECLLGARDDIVLPPESDRIDWEGELAVVIGSSVRRARGEEARAAIAGYSICNDVSMRDWQFRTREWLQGKIWADSTPLGPVLATPDEIPADARLVTLVDGEEMQRGDIHDLVFGPVDLVEYISTVIPLNPGDVIISGTPGGVGNARDPQVFLRPGQEVTVRIDGIGELRNRTVAEEVPEATASAEAPASAEGAGAATS
ncbi:fumarylacetoacetate hydrolase family protein [Brachybacterium kimchii]|uniref:Fumarylacetoacetate hydrolase family protein n=1 Tax=Brachybacterium kimchii TaxID=2942909 RepID=A0ABY4N497_9MICO|nr:fumarylacetoacetate hydrolase family protein [Brachybacterium kimchii]UQN28974.1 fumarylacetoacetate hydrolase family protein [Brachybacterium kimchii]